MKNRKGLFNNYLINGLVDGLLPKLGGNVKFLEIKILKLLKIGTELKLN